MKNMNITITKVAENVCPHCGHKVQLHGGEGWRGSGAGAGDYCGSYYREFGGWALLEYYTCPECGGKWEVKRVESDSARVDCFSYRPIKGDKGGYCPYCGTSEQDYTEWGNETITSRGNKVRVDMSCRACGNWWFGMYTLGSPKVTPLND